MIRPGDRVLEFAVRSSERDKRVSGSTEKICKEEHVPISSVSGVGANSQPQSPSATGGKRFSAQEPAHVDITFLRGISTAAITQIGKAEQPKSGSGDTGTDIQKRKLRDRLSKKLFAAELSENSHAVGVARSNQKPITQTTLSRSTLFGSANFTMSRPTAGDSNQASPADSLTPRRANGTYVNFPEDRIDTIANGVAVVIAGVALYLAGRWFYHTFLQGGM
jgi:hypothetical protein